MCDVTTRTCALLLLNYVATLAVEEVEVVGDVTSFALARHEFEGTTVQELPATHVLLVQLLNDLSKRTGKKRSNLEPPELFLT